MYTVNNHVLTSLVYTRVIVVSPFDEKTILSRQLPSKFVFEQDKSIKIAL